MLTALIYTANLDKEDAVAFEKIYYSYRSMLFNLAKSIVKNEQDAEDVLQNAFMKIADNLHCIEQIESRQTVSFLMVITKNCAFDFLRRQRDIISIDDNTLPELSDTNLEDLVSQISYSELCLCIKSLPSPYNEVLYFHFVYDYSIKETAKILNRRNSTVKMQLVRGKKLLIKALSEVQYG